MEEIHAKARVGFLGISNVNQGQLLQLLAKAKIRPHFVQNRCYAVQGWDREIRKLCAAQGIVYQGFSLLTANRQVLTNRDLIRIAERHQRTTSQVIFRFALDIGMIALIGTTSQAHMQEDQGIFNFRLDCDDIDRLESIAG